MTLQAGRGRGGGQGHEVLEGGSAVGVHVVRYSSWGAGDRAAAQVVFICKGRRVALGSKLQGTKADSVVAQPRAEARDWSNMRSRFVRPRVQPTVPERGLQTKPSSLAERPQNCGSERLRDSQEVTVSARSASGHDRPPSGPLTGSHTSQTLKQFMQIVARLPHWDQVPLCPARKPGLTPGHF